jgi:hypothetical protein
MQLIAIALIMKHQNKLKMYLRWRLNCRTDASFCLEPVLTEQRLNLQLSDRNANRHHLQVQNLYVVSTNAHVGHQQAIAKHPSRRIARP